MDNLKKHLKFLWSLTPQVDESLSLNELKKDQLMQIDIESEKLFELFENSITTLKRYIISKNTNPDIIKNLLFVEPTEIIVQTNKLISNINSESKLLTVVLTWKLNFQNEVLKIQNSYKKARFNFSIIELAELSQFLEDSKKSLLTEMKKYHK
jgi:hypothetical protein